MIDFKLDKDAERFCVGTANSWGKHSMWSEGAPASSQLAHYVEANEIPVGAEFSLSKDDFHKFAGTLMHDAVERGEDYEATYITSSYDHHVVAMKKISLKFKPGHTVEYCGSRY